jgi:hypothetical protein
MPHRGRIRVWHRNPTGVKGEKDHRMTGLFPARLRPHLGQLFSRNVLSALLVSLLAIRNMRSSVVVEIVRLCLEAGGEHQSLMAKMLMATTFPVELIVAIAIVAIPPSRLELGEPPSARPASSRQACS